MSSVIPDNSAVLLKTTHKTQLAHMALMSIVPRHVFVTVTTTKSLWRVVRGSAERESASDGTANVQLMALEGATIQQAA